MLKRGFTLLEIMIVIIVIATLATVALPKYNDAVEKAKAQEGINIIRALYAAERAYQIETQSYTAAESDLDIELPDTLKYFARTLSATCAVANDPCVITLTRATAPVYTLTLRSSDNNGIIVCAGNAFCNKIYDNTNVCSEITCGGKF